MARDSTDSDQALDDRLRPERIAVSLRVRLTNLQDSFTAVTVDVSRTGVLFRIESPLLLRGGEGDPVLALTRQVDAHFGRGVTVVFGGGILRRRMRVTRALAAEDGTPLLACTFLKPLATQDCVLLGIPQADGSWESWDERNG